MFFTVAGGGQAPGGSRGQGVERGGQKEGQGRSYDITNQGKNKRWFRSSTTPPWVPAPRALGLAPVPCSFPRREQRSRRTRIRLAFRLPQTDIQKTGSWNEILEELFRQRSRLHPSLAYCFKKSKDELPGGQDLKTFVASLDALNVTVQHLFPGWRPIGISTYTRCRTWLVHDHDFVNIYCISN